MSKFIDADRLRAEIKKHIKDVKDAGKRLNPNLGFFDAKLSGIYDVMSIIDTIESEPVPSDLEEAVEKQVDESLFKWCYDDEDGIEQYVEDAFIAGVKWQKEQMISEAVEGEITKDNRGNNVVRTGFFNNGFEIGDKVRVIVCKKED